jgi:hypothetical protein
MSPAFESAANDQKRQPCGIQRLPLLFLRTLGELGIGMSTVYSIETANPDTAAFALCLIEDEYGNDLTKHKIYRVVPDEKAVRNGCLHIIDDSGEDYFYPSHFFVLIALSAEIEKALLAAA